MLQLAQGKEWVGPRAQRLFLWCRNGSKGICATHVQNDIHGAALLSLFLFFCFFFCPTQLDASNGGEPDPEMGQERGSRLQELFVMSPPPIIRFDTHLTPFIVGSSRAHCHKVPLPHTHAHTPPAGSRREGTESYMSNDARFQLDCERRSYLLLLLNYPQVAD